MLSVTDMLFLYMFIFHLKKKVYFMTLVALSRFFFGLFFSSVSLLLGFCNVSNMIDSLRLVLTAKIGITFSHMQSTISFDD